MDNFTDYYAILGVTNKATAEEIKRAYRDKCFILHPDRFQTVPETARKRAEEELKLVNKAYEILKDARKRKDYDTQWETLKNKPKPVVEPKNIQFRDVKPGEIRTASFIVRNAGGPYRTISIPNPGTWVTLAEWHSVSTSDELPLKVSIQAEAPHKGKKLSEIITVKLDDEKAQVAVSLNTKRKPRSIVEEIEEEISKPLSYIRNRKWLCSLLLVFALSLVGLGISVRIGSFIPLWVLLGVSVIYSIEKWSGYYTVKHKNVGRIYRLILNLSTLSLLGLLIWSGVSLFTQQFMRSPLIGSLLFLAEFAVFIWLCRVVSRNSWRQPSMKLTVFCLICLFLIFSFAGVQPLSTYKDSLFNSISTYFRNANQPDTTPSDTTPSPSDEINSHTGEYENYYLGLVNSPEGYLSGHGCYDDTGHFIVLINNENATNPSYSELVSFLQRDKTDEFPYNYEIGPTTSYYGTPESHVDLENIQNIIDGTAQPSNPHVCGDFAERLHNNAEMTGIRCAYVSVYLSGYSDSYEYGIPSDTSHALVAFDTSDKGLVYIDDTGITGYGPSNCDKIVDVQVGEHYIPISLFPEVGWSSTWGDMGLIDDIFITWDGEWN